MRLRRLRLRLWTLLLLLRLLHRLRRMILLRRLGDLLRRVIFRYSRRMRLLLWHLSRLRNLGRLPQGSRFRRRDGLSTRLELLRLRGRMRLRDLLRLHRLRLRQLLLRVWRGLGQMIEIIHYRRGAAIGAGGLRG